VDEVRVRVRLGERRRLARLVDPAPVNRIAEAAGVAEQDRRAHDQPGGHEERDGPAIDANHAPASELPRRDRV
jgi:hypothetical protein